MQALIEERYPYPETKGVDSSFGSTAERQAPINSW
jgi:hypothetical protein